MKSRCRGKDNEKQSCETSFLIFIITLAALSSSWAANSSSDEQPKVVVEERVFDFEKVIEGTRVQHDFKIHNQGSADLAILSVRSGCGCATVDFSRKVAPGSHGSITLALDTNGYGGRKMSKKIIVKTNDPANSILTLWMRGPVEKFATIIPRWVKLEGQAGHPIQQVVKITPETSHLFQIRGVRMKSGNNIRCSLSTKSNDSIPTYLLTVENIKKEKGDYFDTINIDTSSPVKPLIYIRVAGYIH